MIASVRGEVIDIALDHAVIEAAGVGYKIMATPATLSTLRRGTESRLITAMIVREDSQTLYGFADSDARDLFNVLLGVSGVGPKIALATLAVYDAPALRQALADAGAADPAIRRIWVAGSPWRADPDNLRILVLFEDSSLLMTAEVGGRVDALLAVMSVHGAGMVVRSQREHRWLRKRIEALPDAQVFAR